MLDGEFGAREQIVHCLIKHKAEASHVHAHAVGVSHVHKADLFGMIHFVGEVGHVVVDQRAQYGGFELNVLVVGNLPKGDRFMVAFGGVVVQTLDFDFLLRHVVLFKLRRKAS